jgi:hypothetical protein
LSDTRRILRPLCAQSSKGARQSLFESIGRRDAGKSLPEKNAKPAMKFHPCFAFWTKAHMGAEVFLFLLAEGSVEEEVHNAFHIVT